MLLRPQIHALPDVPLHIIHERQERAHFGLFRKTNVRKSGKYHDDQANGQTKKDPASQIPE
jgi:hypothetical protein